jgi:hypothetical protein
VARAVGRDRLAEILAGLHELSAALDSVRRRR